jgi:hypothetical protein
MPDPTDFPLPPVRQTPSGQLRRVGVELELGGLELDAVARIVAAHLGGPVTELGRYELQVGGDGAGAWTVELDFTWLKELGRQQRDPEDVLTPIEEVGERVLLSTTEWLIPVEIISPPLPMDRLAEVDVLIARLRAAGAQGTGGALHYAFGLQLNPEVPGSDGVTLLRYLRAFLCLADWLTKRARVDLARRLTAYVEPFPRGYIRRVLDPDYRPALAGLIDDYLEANPTRNRALDFLPLFLQLDPRRVRDVVTDVRVKPRPALHYRLPNCEIDRPDWGLRPVWNDWLQVEYLAAEPDRLGALCTAYIEFLDRPLGQLFESWADRVEPWLPSTADRWSP